MERTTNLAKLKAGVAFTWGELVQIYEVGKYAFGEYHPWKRSGIEILVGEASMEKAYFIWLNGRDIGRSCSSLEQAMASAIAYAFDGVNSCAGMFFCRMVGIEEE